VADFDYTSLSPPFWLSEAIIQAVSSRPEVNKVAETFIKGLEDASEFK
jgi:hypothetical protein